MKHSGSKALRNAVCAIITVLILLTSISLTAFAEVTAPSPATADIVISGAAEGDKFSAYKLIDITHDGTTNTLSFAWTAAVQAILDGKADTTTVEAFAGSDKDTRQDFIAVITKALIDVTAEPAKKDVSVGSNGQAVFSSLAWGEYLLVPTLTTSVYEIMIGAVQPVGNGSAWTVTQGEALTVKKSAGPVISKTASITNVGSWTTITYTLEFDVPKYDGTVTDPTFSISDSADEALSFAGNLTVSGLTASVPTALSTEEVTNAASTSIPANGTAKYNLKLDFAYGTIKTYDKIKVTYNAVINTSADLNTDIGNNAVLTYSNYPYVENSHKTVSDSAAVKTFGVKLFTYDNSSTDKTGFAEVTADPGVKALPDAKFDIYRPAETGEIGISVPGITGTFIKIDTVVSGADGFAELPYVQSGKYYLVETLAPSGYNHLNTPVEINFTEEQVDENGYYDLLVSHSSGINLPQTGGIGTMIFTVSGIAMMVGAVVLLVLLRKKRTSAGNK